MTGATLALPAHAALIALLLPISIVYDRICRLRSMRRVGSRAEVPRVAAADVALADLVRRRQPAVIQGLAGRLGLRRPLDLSLLRAMAATVQGKFEVRSYKALCPYFLYRGNYGRELDHTSEMSLEELLDAMFDPGATPDHVIYQLFGAQSLDGAVGGIIDEVAEGLARLLPHEPEKSASGIWVGSKGVVTPLHYDAWTGLLFQLHGAKRVLMFAPEDGANLYFTPPLAVKERFSALPGRSGDADPADFPRLTRAIRHEARLESGDALYIPPFWGHEIEALEPNVSMPFRFKMKAREVFHPGFVRPACEVFHRKYLAGPAPSKQSG